MKTWRVKEVWQCTGWATVVAASLEDAERLLDEGHGDFDEGRGEWEYIRTVGEIEEGV